MRIVGWKNRRGRIFKEIGEMGIIYSIREKSIKINEGEKNLIIKLCRVLNFEIYILRRVDMEL